DDRAAAKHRAGPAEAERVRGVALLPAERVVVPPEPALRIRALQPVPVLVVAYIGVEAVRRWNAGSGAVELREEVRALLQDHDLKTGFGQQPANGAAAAAAAHHDEVRVLHGLAPLLRTE